MIESVFTKCGKELKPDYFLSYGFDDNCFAIVGSDLYIRSKILDSYVLLKKDWREEYERRR
jgi:hypothetical protein